MTIKKSYSVVQFNEGGFNALDQNVGRLYTTKIEGRFFTSGSNVTQNPYQSIEHFQVNFSANGSPTIAQTFALADVHSKILYANAHAKHSAIVAFVTDVTNTSVTIECKTVSGTANFSAVTTASFAVFAQVVGSSP